MIFQLTQKARDLLGLTPKDLDEVAANDPPLLTSMAAFSARMVASATSADPADNGGDAEAGAG